MHLALHPESVCRHPFACFVRALMPSSKRFRDQAPPPEAKRDRARRPKTPRASPLAIASSAQATQVQATPEPRERSSVARLRLAHAVHRGQARLSRRPFATFNLLSTCSCSRPVILPVRRLRRPAGERGEPPQVVAEHRFREKDPRPEQVEQ